MMHMYCIDVFPGYGGAALLCIHSHFCSVIQTAYDSIEILT